MDRHLGKRVTAGEVRACSRTCRSLYSSVRSAAAQPPQSLVRLSLALCAPHRPQSRRCAKAEVRACLPRQTRASTEPANRQMIVLGTSLRKLKPRPSAGSCYCRSARAAAAPGLGASLYCSSRFRDLWQVGPGTHGRIPRTLMHVVRPKVPCVERTVRKGLSVRPLSAETSATRTG